MNDSLGSFGSLPPFLSKTYEMVDDPSSDSIVSWSETNKSFTVWNHSELARDLLPRFFKHNNFSSFIRQLNIYGFKKIDPGKWEFANDYFIRGQPNLLRKIKRKKPVHSHSDRKKPVSSHSDQNVQTEGTDTLTEQERQGLKDEIERLKKEKESILSAVQEHEEERTQLDSQIRSLKDRFHYMEQRQRNMVSNLANVLRKPGLALTLLFESEPNDRKRRLPRLSYLHDEEDEEESMLETSQNSNKENSEEASSGLISMMDLYDQLEASLTMWENIISDAQESFDQRVSNSNNLELDEAAACAEGPAIDMNSELCMVASSELPGPAPLKEQKVTNPVRTGVNDVFWAQFLTEDPGSSETQEVQSERKDGYLCSMRTVNNLAEQMGHLTPAEKT